MTAIRRATIDDVPELVRLGALMHAESDYGAHGIGYSGQRFASVAAEILKSDQAIFTVAESGGAVVGMAMALTYEPYFSEQRIAEEVIWFVEKSSRTGTGRAMAKDLEVRAREKGARLLSMTTTETMRPEAVSSVYRRMGYLPQQRTFMKDL